TRHRLPFPGERSPPFSRRPIGPPFGPLPPIPHTRQAPSRIPTGFPPVLPERPDPSRKSRSDLPTGRQTEPMASLPSSILDYHISAACAEYPPTPEKWQTAYEH